MDKKEKKPLFKKPAFWITLIVILIVIIAPIMIFTAIFTSKSMDIMTDSISPTTSIQEESKEEVVKLPLQETYDKISTGMTKEEVGSIIGKDTGSCTTTDNEYLGKIENCSYGSFTNNIFDGGMIVVIYQNDKLDTKSITRF